MEEPVQYEEEQPTPQERVQQLTGKVQAVLNSIVERVGKRNLLYAAIIVIVVIAVWLVWSLLPRQASLTLTIVELDNEAKSVDGAEITVCHASAGSCDAEGVQLLAAPALSEGGVARFGGLPANTPLLVSVDASAQGSSKTRKVLTLSPDQENVQKVGVPKPWSVALSPVAVTLDAAPGCRAELRVNSTNTGDKEATLELVSSSPFFQSLEAAQPLPVGGSVEGRFAIVVPPTAARDSSQSMDVRAKYTEAKSSVNVKIGAPPEVDVTPSDITCRLAQCSEFITIKNKGKTVLRNVRIDVFEESGVQGSISLPGFAAGADLAPGEERQVIIALSPRGTGAGLLTVTGACYSKQVRVRLQPGI